jgi:hypothetical protein
MTGIYYPQLLDVLRAAGVKVAESSTTNGWQTRSRSSGGFPSTPLGIIWHHTASSTSPANDLAYMINGSPDGPVGNMLLDRTGTVWPIAAGAANTAGKGGPTTFSRGTVPLDQGNTRTWNIEAANNGVGEPWPQVQIDAYFAASNALSQLFGNLPTDIVGHAHYTPGRKIDPATAGAVLGPWRPRSINSSQTWNLDDMRAEATRRAGARPPDPTPEPPTPTPPEQDDDMAATFIIRNTATGAVALVYGDGRLTGLAGPDLAGYAARFGDPIPTDPVVFDDMASKG